MKKNRNCEKKKSTIRIRHLTEKTNIIQNVTQYIYNINTKKKY